VFIISLRPLNAVWGRVALLLVAVVYGVVCVRGADPLASRILFVVFAGGVIVLVFYSATRSGR